MGLNLTEDKFRAVLGKWWYAKDHKNRTLDQLTKMVLAKGLIMSTSVEKHLELLGMEVKDKSSDYKGVVTSICFDLYGCIQADIRPRELDKEGKLQNGFWLDINRLKITKKKPVMKAPDFNYGPVADGVQGASDKSSTRSVK